MTTSTLGTGHVWTRSQSLVPTLPTEAHNVLRMYVSAFHYCFINICCYLVSWQCRITSLTRPLLTHISSTLSPPRPGRAQFLLSALKPLPDARFWNMPPKASVFPVPKPRLLSSHVGPPLDCWYQESAITTCQHPARLVRFTCAADVSNMSCLKARVSVANAPTNATTKIDRTPRWTAADGRKQSARQAKDGSCSSNGSFGERLCALIRGELAAHFFIPSYSVVMRGPQVRHISLGREQEVWPNTLTPPRRL
jgi:hypothetical protein